MNRYGTKCLQRHGKVRIVSPLTAVFFLPCAGKEYVAVSVLSWSKAEACYGLYIVQMYRLWMYRCNAPKHSTNPLHFFTGRWFTFSVLCYICIGIQSFILQQLQLKNKHPSITPCFFSWERFCKTLLKLITFVLEILGLHKPLWHEIFL